MFIRSCLAVGGAGVSVVGLREIRAAHRAFLSPSHGTKNPSMSAIGILQHLLLLAITAHQDVIPLTDMATVVRVL